MHARWDRIFWTILASILCPTVLDTTPNLCCAAEGELVLMNSPNGDG